MTDALSKQPLLKLYKNFLVLRFKSSNEENKFNRKIENLKFKFQAFIGLLKLWKSHKNTLEQLQVICSSYEEFKFKAKLAEGEVIALRTVLSTNGLYDENFKSRQRTSANLELSLK